MDTQIASIFSNQKLSNFVVEEQFGRISLAIVVLFDSVMYVIHHTVCVGLLLQFSMSDYQ